jgi:hypothetical protein
MRQRSANRLIDSIVRSACGDGPWIGLVQQLFRSTNEEPFTSFGKLYPDRSRKEGHSYSDALSTRTTWWNGYWYTSSKYAECTRPVRASLLTLCRQYGTSGGGCPSFKILHLLTLTVSTISLTPERNATHATWKGSPARRSP